MTVSPQGSGSASARAVFERTVTEAVRRAKTAARNDVMFVPTGVDDVNTILAARVFLRGTMGQSAAIGNRPLTFDTHLTGASYDGTADVTLGTDATDAATPSTLVARDASGHAALVQLILGATGFIGDTGAGSLDLWTTGAGAHVRILNSSFVTSVDIDASGNMDVRGNITVPNVVVGHQVAATGPIGANGKTPPAAAAAPAAAGATYGATEQTAINDIILRLKNFGLYT